MKFWFRCLALPLLTAAGARIPVRFLRGFSLMIWLSPHSTGNPYSREENQPTHEEEELARKRLDKRVLPRDAFNHGYRQMLEQTRLQTDAFNEENMMNMITTTRLVRIASVAKKKTLHPQLPARKDGPDRDED